MENKLTAEEAIEILTKSKNIRDKFDPRKNTIYSEAITMAIEALQSKPKQGGLTAEEMLNKHIDWADAPFGMPMKSIIKAMHEYALQSQPPTVTEVADKVCVHPTEDRINWHDSAVLCNRCRCIISQFGKEINPPQPLI